MNYYCGLQISRYQQIGMNCNILCFVRGLKLLHTFSPSFMSDQETTTVAKLPKFTYIPDFQSYIKLLFECRRTKSLRPGMQIHALMKQYSVCGDPILHNYLMNVYTKCQAFEYARFLINELEQPNLISLSTLISGYAQNGFCREALLVFQELRLLGIMSNEFAFSSSIMACSQMRDLKVGKQIHGLAVATGFVCDVFVTNALVVAYAKCGVVSDSRKLFDETLLPSVVSWNALFSCYVQGNLCGEAMAFFQQMVLSGVRLDAFSLSGMLNACSSLGDSSLGRKTHGRVIKLGCESNSFTANSLVDMYAKVGNHHASMTVFDKIENPDLVSWNTVISGCVLHGYYFLALELLEEMIKSGTRPNMFTISSTLKMCSALENNVLGIQLHASLIKSVRNPDLTASSCLVDMYSKCGLTSDAKKIYDSMNGKDIFACNAMLSGFTQNNEDIESLHVFIDAHREGLGFDHTTLSMISKSIGSLQSPMICRCVHAVSVKLGLESDSFVANGLLDSYGKCGSMDDALKIFNHQSDRTAVFLTSLINAYSLNGQSEEALTLFNEIQSLGIAPDHIFHTSLLNACANLSTYAVGKQIHGQVIKHGFQSGTFAGNSLVSMYSKCGSIDDAARSFSEIPSRGVISWSTMIGALARHGCENDALELFHEMVRSNIAPNDVTLVHVLHACGHAGMVDEGRRYFYSMRDAYGIEPNDLHYGCMIDLLARAGRLEEAVGLMERMPFDANASVWGSLLSASKIYKDTELGRKAAEMLFILEPENTGGTRAVLSNLYASVGAWDEVSNVRRLIKDGRIKKETGLSWVEIRGATHAFNVDDRSHPMSDEIYGMVGELNGQCENFMELAELL